MLEKLFHYQHTFNQNLNTTFSKQTGGWVENTTQNTSRIPLYTTMETPKFRPFVSNLARDSFQEVQMFPNKNPASPFATIFLKVYHPKGTIIFKMVATTSRENTPEVTIRFAAPVSAWAFVAGPGIKSHILTTFFVVILFQLMLNWWFGLVVWIPRIPFCKGLLLMGTPGIQNHQPKPPIYH